jgi:hypothetical protein
MANEPLPNQVPDIALPDLKKKQKEKKKAGAAWGSGGQGAEAFEGATGGLGRGAASAAARAAAAAGEAALEGAVSEAGFVARLLAGLSEFGATLVGRAVLTALAALIIGGGGYMVYKALGYGAKTGQSALDLGGIASNLRVHSDDASGLDMARGAGRGSLNFQDGKAGEAAKAGEAGKDGEKAKDGEEGKPGEAPKDNADTAFGERPNQDRLAHNLSGAKLSSDLGGGGNGSAFASNAKGKFNDPLGYGRTSVDKGKAAALRRVGATGNRALNLGRRGIRANRALGQLKTMAPMGAAMTTAATADEAGQAATTQFEGASPIGASAPTTPGGLDGTNPVTPTTPSTPPCTSSDPNACGYAVPGYTDDTKALGQLVQQAHDQIQQAITWLLVAAVTCLALEAIAAIWFGTCCAFIGAIIMAIAILVAVLAIVMCIVMGQMIKQMAEQMKQAGAALGTDGQPSPQANEIADKVSSMGDDITTGGWSSVFAGIGGFMAADKVSHENDALQDMANGLEQKGNTPVDTSQECTDSNKADCSTSRDHRGSGSTTDHRTP